MRRDPANITREWVKEALKHELRKRGMTYEYLARRLAEWGIDETESSLRNKLSRGTFSAAFFVECLAAVGVPNLRLDVAELIRISTGKGRPSTRTQMGGEPPVTRLHWSKIQPESCTVITLPNEAYPPDARFFRNTHTCGYCENVLLQGWRADRVESVFGGTDLVAKCAKCGFYNELPGSTVKV